MCPSLATARLLRPSKDSSDERTWRDLRLMSPYAVGPGAQYGQLCVRRGVPAFSRGLRGRLVDGGAEQYAPPPL